MENINNKERLYLRSSEHKDYFKIQGEETDECLVYLKTTSLQFNDHQIGLQNIVGQYNLMLRQKESLLKALKEIAETTVEQDACETAEYAIKQNDL